MAQSVEGSDQWSKGHWFESPLRQPSLAGHICWDSFLVIISCHSSIHPRWDQCAVKPTFISFLVASHRTSTAVYVVISRCFSQDQYSGIRRYFSLLLTGPVQRYTSLFPIVSHRTSTAVYGVSSRRRSPSWRWWLVVMRWFSSDYLTGSICYSVYRELSRRWPRHSPRYICKP